MIWLAAIVLFAAVGVGLLAGWFFRGEYEASRRQGHEIDLIGAGR